MAQPAVVSDVHLPGPAVLSASTVSRAHDAIVDRRRVVLLGLVLLQIALVTVFFVSVSRNSWLAYQGGDQIWMYTSGWLLSNATVPFALVGYGWPLVLAPFAVFFGPAFVAALPALIGFDVLVLGPIALLAVYDIGARIAGRLAGLWCATLWVVAPFLSIPLFVDRYHERWVDQFLPQALGFTQLADYPSMVTLAVAAALVLRSLEHRQLPPALLAGLVAGWAIGLKPANALFLVGPFAAYVIARRWRSGLSFAAALAPAVLTLTVWKYRGLGEVPLFALEAQRWAAGAAASLPAATTWFDRVVPLDGDVWGENMRDLQEFFWSARLVQWVPFAGALAVGRRSWPAAGLLLSWLLAVVVVKGSSPVATVESGSFWRLVMPAWPAYLVLLAFVPLLVPTLAARLGHRLDPTSVRAPGRRTVVAAVVALGVLPLLVVLAASPQRGPGQAVDLDGILTPVDGSTLALGSTWDGRAVRLAWRDQTGFPNVYFRVFRTVEPGSDTSCTRSGDGADRCRVTSVELARTRLLTYVDGSPEPGVTYRVGAAANWKGDMKEGDTYLLSPPITLAPPP